MANEQLGVQDVFRFLRPDQVNAISKASVTASYKAGEVVYTKEAKAKYIFIVLGGQVALRFPSGGGVILLIDQLGPGAMFGSSSSFDLDTYMLTAQCLFDCRILRIETAALRRLMDEDPRMGYVIQMRISEIFFKRYVDAMQKLQAIVTKLPLEPR